MALEMLQRFASRVPAVAEDRIFQRDLAAACLFLASKADEHTLKVRAVASLAAPRLRHRIIGISSLLNTRLSSQTNDLLNTVHHLDGSPLEAVPLAVQLFPDLFAGKQVSSRAALGYVLCSYVLHAYDESSSSLARGPLGRCRTMGMPRKRSARKGLRRPPVRLRRRLRKPAEASWWPRTTTWRRTCC